MEPQDAGMLQDYIALVVEGHDLSEEQAHEAMSVIMGGHATDAQVAGFLVGLRVKGETIPEITGCARAMREAATRINVGELDVVDTCGTGGTHKGTFNVSTASAIVTAGAGVPVAKHGNRGASSSFGSADVLQTLGVNIEAEPPLVERCVREAGIGFLFAPLLHQAMRHAIGPRRELAIRTVFNILGPLTNPAGARRQVLGVFKEDLVEPIAGVLHNLGAERAMVVHSMDGMDEISLCDETLTAVVEAGQVQVRGIAPEDVGLDRVDRSALAADSAASSAMVIRSVLDGQAGPPRDMVLLNAGAAIYVGGLAGSLEEGIAAAAKAVDSGKAKDTLARLVAVSNETV
ncbi:MAG: anthranilate phosphoribosyltransferase [Candidatus Brocadiia bacterium]